MYVATLAYFIMLYGTIIIFVVRYRHLGSALKLLIYYLMMLAMGNSLAMVLSLQFDVKNNLFLFHFTTPLEYLLLCLPFYHALENRISKMAILVSMAGFVIVAAICSLYIDKLEDNNTSARIVEALLVTTWIMLYFRQLSTSEKIVSFSGEPLFWVFTGFLFYFLGTLFLQGLLNYLIKLDKAFAHRLYILQYLFEYVLFITINAGVFCGEIFRKPLKKTIVPGRPLKKTGF